MGGRVRKGKGRREREGEKAKIARSGEGEGVGIFAKGGGGILHFYCLDSFLLFSIQPASMNNITSWPLDIALLGREGGGRRE